MITVDRLALKTKLLFLGEKRAAIVAETASTEFARTYAWVEISEQDFYLAGNTYCHESGEHLYETGTDSFKSRLTPSGIRFWKKHNADHEGKVIRGWYNRIRHSVKKSVNLTQQETSLVYDVLSEEVNRHRLSATR